MARCRKLSTEISTDEKVSRLARECGEFAALLYTWMIPHAADDATLPRNSEKILFSVIPGLGRNAEDVEVALQGIFALGLAVDDPKNLRIIINPASFYKYQTYIPGKKRMSQAVFDEVKQDNFVLLQNAMGTKEGVEPVSNRDQRKITVPPKKGASPSPSPSPSPSLLLTSLRSVSCPTTAKIIEKWNEAACAHNWQKSRGMSSDTAKVKTALKRAEFREVWESNMADLLEHGLNFVGKPGDHENWTPNIQWFLRPLTQQRLAQGEYWRERVVEEVYSDDLKRKFTEHVGDSEYTELQGRLDLLAERSKDGG